MRTLTILCVAASIAGCAAHALVKYTPITGPDRNGLTKFQFAESIITFNYGKTSAGIPNNDIVISSVPVPYGNKYGISGTGFWENYGVTTIVNASFRGNSTLIQQLSSSVSDKRQQAITSLASIAGTLGGLLSIPSEQPSVTLPKGISVTSFLAHLPPTCVAPRGAKGQISCHDLKLDGTKDFTADISVSKVPVDAFKMKQAMSKSFYSSNFFYSACRQMTITLNPAPGLGRGPVSATVAVADPTYVETLNIPAKGTITVAPSCGANSKAEDPNLPTAIDYLNTLATQAKAVKQALSGSNSSGVSSKSK